MEKKFYTDEFEQLLKDKSDQFRMYPSKRVWHSIYNDLHPGRKWPSVAMSMTLVIVLLLVGYLNTGDSEISRQNSTATEEQVGIANNNSGKSRNKNRTSVVNAKDQQMVNAGFEDPAGEDFSITAGIADNSTVTGIDPVTGLNIELIANNSGIASAVTRQQAGNNGNDILQTVDSYIKTNQIFTDIAAVNNKKRKTKAVPTSTTSKNHDDEEEEFTGDSPTGANAANKKKATTDLKYANAAAITTSADSPELNNAGQSSPVSDNSVSKKDLDAKKTLSTAEKAWIENYAMHNKPQRGKWKGRLALELYVTPAINYRKLSTDTKGSATPFANSDINGAVSHRPGLGIEGGIGLSYAFAKNLRLKAGIQYNSTSYGIDADKTSHPILTSLLLNDISTGYSYPTTRTSTLANPHNSTALQPVTIHNTTHQVSVPIGIAYKLASANRLEWFAGASIQPSYVFGGNAYLLSSDMKDYVSEPSLMRNWNLNTGFETYINYKLGGFNLQVGPHARYQLLSTYKKRYALIEKPYAIGLRIGIVKGF